jgi:methylmalonyl-CoA mutase C-terminal domain/subunit
MHYFKEVVEGLAARGGDDILVFGGGIVPDQDLASLEQMGVGAIFTPGANTHDVVEYLRGRVPERRAAEV